MFNLSTTGNVGYNGISKLSESRCTPQFKPSERTAVSGTKMRYTNTGNRSKYASNFKTPLYLSDTKSESQDSRLKLTDANDDVYTFNDADTPVIVNRTPNSFLKESVSSNKTDFVCARKPFSGSLLTSKKVHITKPVNGFNFRKTVVESKNGVYKATGDVSKNLQNIVLPTQRIVVKQNKDLFDKTPVFVKSETEKIVPIVNDVLNHSTKTSITNFNVKPSTKLSFVCQDKKMPDVIKKETVSSWGSDGIITNLPILPSSSHKISSNIVIPAKKLPSGKPHPSSLKVRKGRGPAVHEALERINPLPLPRPSKSAVSKKKWHAPGTELFDCGVLDTSHVRIDSDSSEDYTYDCMNDWDFDRYEIDDEDDKSSTSCTSLRRHITLLHQLEKITELTESDTALYNSIKTQMRKQRRTIPTEGFRLEDSTLNSLLASRGTSSVLSATDKKRIKYSGRLLEPVECARPGCGAPALACARLCLAHISLNPEQRLFTECTAKFSDNTQCRVPVVDVRNDLPLCSEHTWKKDNYMKNVQETKPKKSSRKRPKTCSTTMRPSKRNHKKTPVIGVNTDNGIICSKSFPGDNFLELNGDAKLFSSPNIENGVSSGFLSHEDTTELNVCSNSSACESSEDNGVGVLSESELINATNHNHQMVDADVVAEVLALHESGGLDLAATGPPQEPNIDLSNVFNDFFAETNGLYIPSPEETEELERALEAVKSLELEKLTNPQNATNLLDTFLDEKTLNETLVGFTDVFGNIPPVKVPAGESLDSASSPS